MISLLSVENTGTHFTAGVIRTLTGKNVQWATPVNRDAFNTPDIGCMIQHVYPSDFLSHADFMVRLMLRADKVVVPMRDPIKALISNHDRGMEALPYREHVRSFERVAGWWGRPNVRFFQVDVNEADRGLEIVKIALFFGLEPPDTSEIDWNRRPNATPPSKRSKLRGLYENRRFSELDEALDGAISALEPLSGFFSRFGYEIPVVSCT